MIRRAGRGLALLAALLVAPLSRAQPEPTADPPPAVAPASDATEPAPQAELAPQTETEAALPDAAELARRAEDVLRGQGSTLDATMTILSRKRPRSRELSLRVFDDRRTDRALVRVLSPPEQAGTALLKLPPNLWLFSADERETLRIPRAAWREPFLGSDFSREDLVRGSRLVRDYEQRIVDVDERAGEGADRRAFVVAYTARPDAPVAWGRIRVWIDAEHATPLRLDFFAPDGALARTLWLSDVREVAGRRFPHLWVMRPAGDGRRETRLEVNEIRFVSGFEEGLFTTRRLAGPLRPGSP